MIGIYKITSPSNKVYIGQSVNIEKRFKAYRYGHCKLQTILYRSFLKYGIDNHIFEIIETCSIDELNQKERHYQDLYKAMSNQGLNCQLTKTSDKSGERNDEFKKKLSIAKKGMPVSESTRKKISKTMIGVKKSEETKKRMSLASKGKPKSKEATLKNRIGHLGIKQSKETILKRKISLTGKKRSKDICLKFSENNTTSKIILDTSNGVYYRSITELANILGVNRRTLNNRLNGTHKNNTKYLLT